MDKLKVLLLVIILTLAGGCGESSALVKATSAAVRTDVFEELTSGGDATQGFADVRITATLKTHRQGVYSANDPHGTPEYKMQLSIDGQTVMIQGRLQKENLIPKKPEDPEAGEGARYRFGKTLRLKPGKHSIVVAFPGDRLAVEKEIILLEGNENSLVIEPIYGRILGKKRPSASRVTSFREGITGIRFFLNGSSI